MSDNNNNVEDFNWDTIEPIETPKPTDTETVLQEVEEAKDPTEPEDLTMPKEKKEEFDWEETKPITEEINTSTKDNDDGDGGDDENEEEEQLNDNGDEGEEGGDEEEDEKDEILNSIKALQKEGFLDVEIPEIGKDEELDVKNVLKEGIKKQVDNEVEGLLKELPSIVKNLNHFVLEGGNQGEYLKKLFTSDTVELIDKVDLEKEADQEYVLKTLLKEEGLSAQAIEDEIEYYKDRNKLKDRAENKHKAWLSRKEKEAKKIAEAKALENRKTARIQKEFRDNVSIALATEDKDFKFTEEEKRDLPRYIFEPSIELENGKKITGMQKALYEIHKDPVKLAMLAKLIKSDLNLKELKTTEKNKAIELVRKKIKNKKVISKKGQRKDVKSKKRLADLL